ncbi:MAG TPA: hypothetical protein VL978_13875, partial [Puia sp.]|nr:hypothetical protein [Puia sp.]
MKKFVLFCFTVMAAAASMAQDSIWIVPALPQRGARVTIYFKSEKPAFAHTKTLSGGFYSLDALNRIVAQDLAFGRSGDNWTATATVPDTAYAVVANIVRPDTDAFAAAVAAGLDSSNGTPFLKSYLALGYTYFNQTQSLGIPSDPAKGHALFEQYWKGLPEPPSSFSAKLSWYLMAKKDTAKILNLSADLPLDSTAVETDYLMAAGLARQLGNRPLSRLLNNICHRKYPHGEWNRFDYYNRVLAAKDTAEQWGIIREYKKAYPDERPQQSLLPAFESIMQKQLIASGDLSGAMALIPKDASAHDIAGEYNFLAWEACVKDLQLSLALSLSKASLDTLLALEASGRDKPVAETRAQYLKSLTGEYALFADTYAYLLYKTGAYKEAFAYEKKSLAASGPSPQLDIISRYHLFMEKAEKPSKVVASLSA